MRRAPLRSDPTKVREWNDKHRQAFAARGFTPERAPLKRARRKRRPAVPPETRMAVRARSGGKCVVCVFYGCKRPRKAEHIHHCLDVQGFPELAVVGDGMIGICGSHHQAHHYQPGGRIPRAALPLCVLRLAADVGDAATLHLERFYPEHVIRVDEQSAKIAAAEAFTLAPSDPPADE